MNQITATKRKKKQNPCSALEQCTVFRRKTGKALTLLTAYLHKTSNRLKGQLPEQGGHTQVCQNLLGALVQVPELGNTCLKPVLRRHQPPCLYMMQVKI